MSLTQGMKAKQLLGYYQAKTDEDARKAKERGGKTSIRAGNRTNGNLRNIG